MMTIIETLVVLWCLSVCLSDLHARRIPNTLTIAGCLIAVFSLLFTGHTLLGESWQSAVLGTIISLLLTLPAYVARLLGAGDVKLILVIALIGGLYLTLFSFVIASFLSILLSFSYFIFTQFSAQKNNPKRWIPFGAALSAGLLCAIGVVR